MQRLSRERIAQLAGEIVDAIVRSRSIALLKDRDVVRQSIAHLLADELQREVERENNVRARISVTRDAPRPGSREYDELFRKLLEEEYVRDSSDL